MLKKFLSTLLCFAVFIPLMTGCGSNEKKTAQTTSGVVSTEKTPKYIFMFIGDGMTNTQINAAQVYKGNNKSGEVDTKKLNFTQFPYTGVVTTHDSTSFAPDSASTATSLSTGVKTHSGVIGLKADKQTVAESITEKLKKEKDMKIGVVTSVSIDHATPAAYYAHSPSRDEYYDIANQLPKSNFDYFAGGALKEPTGNNKDKPDAYKAIENGGYKIVKTKEEILNLNKSSGKTYAISPALQDSKSMPYKIDAKEGDLTLADFVKKGIDVLDNEKGFFLMTESGKIDWACHANDAKSAMGEVYALEDAVQVALDFAKEHKDETLIITTGDHETGGMSIGYAATGYDTAFNILDNQKKSYVEFDKLISKMKEENKDLQFDNVMPVITENFGLIAPNSEASKNESKKALVLTDGEYKKLQNAFAESMKPKETVTKNEDTAVLYGTYDPLSVTITHIINNKAGIGWTTYSHTGTPAAVYATGAGAEDFEGSYDNTDIFKKLVEVTKVK
jgi:alkaline phosphatase